METKNVRKPISKKTRFEVLKRDEFTCQYCGRKAPDVILHIDHINPVAKGGDNNILNLITSCADCNLGKKHNLLSDNTVVEKQKKEIKELNKKRKELESLVREREKVRDFGDAELNEAVKHYNSKFINNHISYVDTQTLKRIIKKFGLVAVLNAIDDVNYRYREPNEFTKCRFLAEKVAKKLYFEAKSPEEKRITYLKSMIKKISDNNYNEKIFYKMINIYKKEGLNIETLITATENRMFYSFKSFVDSIDNCTTK